MKFAKITQTTLLVLDGSNTLSFAAAVDPLRAANRQAGATLFDWRFATPQDAPVTLTSGLTIPAAPMHKVARTDLLLIVAGFNLEAQSTPALLASLRRLAGADTLVAGIDGGPWVMARAGLLDGHAATTHWEDLEKFAVRFPQVATINARYHISGPRLTSGGAAPAIEMMLHLIGDRHGPALAGKVAGSFIYDAHSTSTLPQRRYAEPRHNALTTRAQALMEGALETPVSLAQIAQKLGVTPRALQLQFRTRLGLTPQSHYLSLRLAEAERLIRHTETPLQDIAIATGFGSQSSFARAFRARFGQSARQARNSAKSLPPQAPGTSDRG